MIETRMNVVPLLPLPNSSNFSYKSAQSPKISVGILKLISLKSFSKLKVYIRLHTKFDGQLTLSKVFTAGGSSVFLVFCRFAGGLDDAALVVVLAAVVVVCEVTVAFGLAEGVVTGAEPDVGDCVGLTCTCEVVVVIVDPLGIFVFKCAGVV